MVKGKQQLPARRGGFLAKVRNSKAVAAPSTREVLAKALSSSTRPRLLFGMDATASREHSWDVAKRITAAMFEAVPGELEVALAYHGGGCLKELTPFSADAKAFLDKVHTVRCQAGGTAVNEVLEAAITVPRLKALVYVGDCFEEDVTEAASLAVQLKLKGTRAFIFHDRESGQLGYDVDTAHDVFAQIAATTSGAVLPFDETSPSKVKELLEAIAVYAVGGIKALEQQTKYLPGARILLEHITS